MLRLYMFIYIYKLQFKYTCLDSYKIPCKAQLHKIILEKERIKKKKMHNLYFRKESKLNKFK